jgi:hypothetical protein
MPMFSSETLISSGAGFAGKEDVRRIAKAVQFRVLAPKERAATALVASPW